MGNNVSFLMFLLIGLAFNAFTKCVVAEALKVGVGAIVHCIHTDSHLIL